MMAEERQAVLDHGYVELVDVWGSDERIVEAARMSTGKGFLGWGPQQCLCHGRMTQRLGVPPVVFDPACDKCHGTGVAPGDEKFLAFLWHNRHHTPFEMAGMSIEVQAPLIVFREWQRHRTQSYNELSARYTKLPELVYLPSLDRLRSGKQDTKNKQGSTGGFTDEEAQMLRAELAAAYEKTRVIYNKLLGYGMARELARLVVPVAQYSRMRASANLRNWLAFLLLRLDGGAQWEIRQYAEAVGRIVQAQFPRTYGLFLETQTPTAVSRPR